MGIPSSIRAYVAAGTLLTSAVLGVAAAPGASAIQLAPAPTAAQAYVPAPDLAKSLCKIPVLNHFVPACSSGKWEPMHVKILRCYAGHMPFTGITGAAKSIYWAGKCANDDWRKW